MANCRREFFSVSVLEGLQSYPGNTITHEEGVKLINKVPAGFHEEVDINTTDKRIEEAVASAKDADVVVMVLGEYGFNRVKLDLVQI